MWRFPQAVLAILILALGCAGTQQSNGDSGLAEEGEKIVRSATERRGDRGRDGERGKEETPKPEEELAVEVPDVTGGALLGAKVEELHTLIVDLGAQISDMEVEVGDLRNFKKTATAQMEDTQGALSGLKASVEGTETRLGDLESSLKDQVGIPEQVKGLAEQADRHTGDILDLEEAIGGEVDKIKESMGTISENQETLRDQVFQLDDIKASAKHDHPDLVAKTEFKTWLGEDYKAPQPWWRHIAVSVSSALIAAALALYLSLKAIKPAYAALNDLRIKVSTGLKKKEAEDL
jgi:hypothetical protein